ncbi:DEKNAAC102331 [Brettanomyces naardenensis]|uniref:DEKNAAC102331 n=1 Tax=Brettanomyces naardenensis TaxID=13370 RepID=A0A448YLN4_BRENA|nr:DEKNAAC102331 [Brettanomyces naardenensis]
MSRSIKLVLLGDQGVGKTSLRCQFLYHYFSSSYKATIGADFLMYKAKTKDDSFIDLQIWDTAGQERFNAVSRAFYRGADIGIFVYDITNSESFYDLSKWIENFLSNCGSSKPFVMIVGNKIDNETIRQISYRQAVEFASTQVEEGLIRDVKMDVIETSAKNYRDVEKLFARCGELGEIKLKDDDMVMMSFGSVDVAVRKERRGCC